MPKTTLIAPLHWGLGHASRSIQVIREQLDQGHKVIIAAKDGPKALLQSNFPELTFIDIPFMEITYPRDGNMTWHFTKQGPKLLLSIIREHYALKKIVQDYKVDVVISDGRFGLWSNHCDSYFIHHQLEIKTPVLQGIVNILNRWVMNRYTEVWIPDFESAPGLAGDLSHPRKMPKRYRYIGPLSRFQDALKPTTKTWKNLAIISGPEPQRRLFESDLVRRFVEDGHPSLVVRGQPEKPSKLHIGNLHVVNHLPDTELLDALASAEHIVSRSGYSTIMDFHVLGIKAQYVPTPGQTEQEYLATLHNPSSLEDND